MRGVPVIFAGFGLAMALLGSINHPVSSDRQGAMPTPGRSVPTSEPLSAPTVYATIFLAEPPLDAAVQAAQDEGLSELQLAARLVFYSLRLVSLHNDVIQSLTAPPINAVVVSQSFSHQNTISVQVLAERVSQIQELPGVFSVEIGRPPDTPSQPTEPSRQDHAPGTRIPPPQPPGLD